MIVSTLLLMLACSGPSTPDTHTSPSWAGLPRPAALRRPLRLRDRFGTCLSDTDDLQDIQERGVLRVALPNDGTSWFLHRGQVLGFELEVLERFAEEHDLVVEPVRIPSVSDRHRALVGGTVDVAAGRLANLGWPEVWYSAPLVLSDGALILRPTPGLPEQCPVLPVQGREVAALANHGWARPLSARGARIDLRSDAGTVEHLARDVAAGEAERAIARDDVAALAVDGAPGLEVSAPLGVQTGMHVAVHANAEELQAAFDAWQDANGLLIRVLYEKYFEVRGTTERRRDPDHTATTGRISEWDGLFRKHAPTVGWPWTLIAAQAWQESRFDPKARSWAGARGLMQIMPRTGRSLGVRNLYDPEQSVDGAVRYLRWLDDAFREDIPDPSERIAIVLAAYNAGIGHVEDARALALAHGEDPDQWRVVRSWLLKLEQPSWYRRPEVRYGYVRGTEPARYVDGIRVRAASYAALVDQRSPLQPPAL